MLNYQNTFHPVCLPLSYTFLHRHVRWQIFQATSAGIKNQVWKLHFDIDKHMKRAQEEIVMQFCTATPDVFKPCISTRRQGLIVFLISKKKEIRFFSLFEGKKCVCICMYVYTYMDR